YVLADIEIEFARPASAVHLFHRGEPLWGKAYYVPGAARWENLARELRSSRAALEEALMRAVALYVAADLPGHAFDALRVGAHNDAFTRIDAAQLRADIEAVYRWGRVEAGLDQFAGLARRVFNRRQNVGA